MAKTTTTAGGTIDVFISYSSANENTANMIVDALSSRGVNCWKAGVYTINTGDDFREKIATALDECKIFLLILSQSSMNSPWVKIELTEALRKNKKIYSLRIDDSPIDELFEFKLGCSQISDGTKNLIPVVENLSINIKKDRDAILEKERSEIYSTAKDTFIFNFDLINNICVLFPIFLIAFRVYFIINHPSAYQDNFYRILEQFNPLLLVIFHYLVVHFSYNSYLKKYTELGNPNAQYLTFKKQYKLLANKAKKQRALALLQKSANLGNYKAVKTLANLLLKGKGVEQDLDLAEKYNQLAGQLKSKRKEKIKRGKVSFIANVALSVLLCLTYLLYIFIR